MNVTYWENNQTEISKVMDSGQQKLKIAFTAEGLLKDLPTEFRIPDHIVQEHLHHGGSKFFLNVDSGKDPVQWVIDIGERPL